MMLEVENIGASKGWIAHLTGTDPKYGFARTFIGDRDYSRANKPRTRGVYTQAELAEGEYYEVNDPRAWGRTERYFCTIRNDELVRVEAHEVRSHFQQPKQSMDT